MKKYIKIINIILLIVLFFFIFIYGIAYVMKDKANHQYSREICKQVYEGPKNIINLISKKFIGKDLIGNDKDIKKILKYQEKIDKLIEKEYSELEYSWRQPYIKLNPYGVTPLSALIKFETDNPVKVTLVIKGKKGEEDLIKEYKEYRTEHEYSILGLYPKYENQIILKIEDKIGNIKEKKFKLKTEALSYIKTPNYIVISKKDKQNKFYYTTGNGTYIYDEYGNIRYYLSSEFATWTYKLKNGKIVGEDNERKVYEFNMLGKVVKEYNLGKYFSFSHGIYEMPNNNLLEIVKKDGTVKIENGNKERTAWDILIEIDRKTGKIIKEWDLGEVLDTTRYVIGKSSEDWLHTNSVLYIPEENSLLFSARWYGMFKLDYNTGEVKWLFGPNKGYKRAGRNGTGEELESKVLKAIDSSNKILSKEIQSGKEYTNEFKWAYNTHDARYLGNDLYSIFDNNGDVYDPEIKEQYNSRAVIYEIKEDKIKQVWSQELSDNSNLGSAVIPNLEQNEVIVFMSREENKNTTLYHNKILRYNYATKEKLFEADIYISPQIIGSDEAEYSDYHYKIVPVDIYE